MRAMAGRMMTELYGARRPMRRCWRGGPQRAVGRDGGCRDEGQGAGGGPHDPRGGTGDGTGQRAGFYRSAGLERRFRDIQGARYHAMQRGPQAQYAGAMALGESVATVF
jgi:hypothetical protein